MKKLKKATENNLNRLTVDQIKKRGWQVITFQVNLRVVNKHPEPYWWDNYCNSPFIRIKNETLAVEIGTRINPWSNKLEFYAETTTCAGIIVGKYFQNIKSAVVWLLTIVWMEPERVREYSPEDVQLPKI